MRNVSAIGISLVLLSIGCGDDNATGEDMGIADLNVDRDLSTPDLAPNLDLTIVHDLMSACDADAGVPDTLACAGLYSDWNAKTLSAGVQAYAPGYTLWSDGAVKSRWAQIPAGTKIDVTTENDWVYPVNTKFWKEFKLDIAGSEKRIETRMFWKRGTGDWVGVVYRWTDDESNAVHLSTGEAPVAGTTYEVPAENRCQACHRPLAHTDAPLGFEAVLLADSNATGLNYAALQTQNLLTATNSNATIAASALAIPGTATEKAALGYLHANCGIMCHRVNGSAPFRMDVDVSSGAAPANVQSTTTFAAINVPSTFMLMTPPIIGANYYRFRPTDDMRSMAYLRMSIRDATQGDSGTEQMPPLLTHTKDAAGLAIVDAWIAAMTGGIYPAPAAP